MSRPVSTTVRIRRTIALFSTATLATALVDVTPLHLQTWMIALAGIYAVRLDIR